jgi:alcohol dehydrogenase class IV
MTNASITLHQPRRLAVGAGNVGQVGLWAGDTSSVLVVATPFTAGFVDRLGLSGRVTVFDAIPGEPDIATLDAALDAARRCRPDVIVGLGGGSVLDVAKLVAVLWDGRRRSPTSPAPTGSLGAIRFSPRSRRPLAPAPRPVSGR